MAEELERGKADPPFLEPPRKARNLKLLRDMGVAVLLSPLVSALGIAWIALTLGGKEAP
jgi:hypothetical protein